MSWELWLLFKFCEKAKGKRAAEIFLPGFCHQRGIEFLRSHYKLVGTSYRALGRPKNNKANNAKFPKTHKQVLIVNKKKAIKMRKTRLERWESKFRDKRFSSYTFIDIHLYIYLYINKKFRQLSLKCTRKQIFVSHLMVRQCLT